MGDAWPPFLIEERRCKASATVRGSIHEHRIRGEPHDRKMPIWLQKSAAADEPSAISLSAAGFDAPTLTPSAQLLRNEK